MEPHNPVESGDAAPRPPFASVAETHSGVVVLVGERAYKLKKPLALGFLDFTKREVREAICHREVELNRRLAPDVYLGVADVAGDDGRLCDHLVVMRRLPEERRLSTLVREGHNMVAELRLLARLMSSFHARADRRPTIDAEATADAVLSRWESNSSRMVGLPEEAIDRDDADRLMELARRYLVGREELFAERIRRGRACDGHGDLLADDVFCLADGPRVLDCLEFDDRLRYGDVLGDVAFMAMDLERLGRQDLGDRFLALYGEMAADTWPGSLAHHYVSYRAQVRALVAGIRAGQGQLGSAAEARRLMALALRHAEQGRVRLVVVGGLPGSGKSTLAEAVGMALDAVVLRSDEIRKQRAGLDVTAPAVATPDEQLYEPAAVAGTYAAMLEQAQTCLRRGTSVVLDASFSNPSWRTAARRMAASTLADLDEFECHAPVPVLEQRLARRRAESDDASDATVEVLEEMLTRARPWPQSQRIDTTAPSHEVRHAVIGHLDVTP